MKHKENILKLRSEGKSYDDIAKILGCSKGTVTYHCGAGQKDLAKKRVARFRAKIPPIQRKLYGYRTRQNINNKVQTFGMKGSNNTKRRDQYTDFNVQDVIDKFQKEPKCYLTGKTIDLSKPSTYTFDHIIPKSRGGSCNIDNLGLCTKAANQAKHNLTPEEFIDLCKEILIHHGYKITK